MNDTLPASDPQFASALSTEAELEAAVAEVCRQAGQQIDGTASLAMLFVSSHWREELQAIGRSIGERFDIQCLLGCTGESIVGVGREVEGEPAISLWLARLPGSTLLPMHLQFERSPEGGAIVGWPDILDHDWPEHCALLMLGEPFSFPADVLLERLNDDRAGTAVVGGMASGGAAPGENHLLLNDNSHREGAVAVMIHGGVQVRTVVSQGCRPIGSHLVITKAEQNVIHELGGQPALLQLKKIFDTLPTSEQAQVQQNLHVGRVVSEYQDQFQQGDFLVRNVIGIDPDQGSIAIGDFVRPGQTVQFHIRDAHSADAELKQLLASVRDDAQSNPAAALLFTCNGRGSQLFDTPHHDAATVQSTLGEIPLAGFFAQGELGPVGGKNFMHGFTASIALFDQSS